MPSVKYEVPFDMLQRASQVKFVASAVDADRGDANAIIVSPTRDMLRRGHEVGFVRFMNNSGSALDMALAVRFRNANWVAGQVTAAGVYTADTDAAQDETTGDFQLHDRTDDGSGFLVGADVPWNVLGVIVSAAGDQTVTNRIVEYWNGTAWTPLLNASVTALFIGETSGNQIFVDGTGEHIHVWEIPADWVIGGTPVATVPQDKFNIRFRVDSSAAGTADPTASQMFVGEALLQEPQLASGAGNAKEYTFHPPLRFARQGDALFAIKDTVALDAYVQVAHRFYW